MVNGDIARTNPDIVNRYRNPHLSPNFLEYREDAIIFGDHERSKMFQPPQLYLIENWLRNYRLIFLLIPLIGQVDVVLISNVLQVLPEWLVN